MGDRKVKWNKRALLRLQQISDWYEINVGIKARDNFRRDTLSAVEALRAMPTIGKLDLLTSSETQKRYTFVSHPLIKIEYRFTEGELTIITLRATKQS